MYFRGILMIWVYLSIFCHIRCFVANWVFKKSRTSETKDHAHMTAKYWESLTTQCICWNVRLDFLPTDSYILNIIDYLISSFCISYTTELSSEYLHLSGHTFISKIGATEQDHPMCCANFPLYKPSLLALPFPFQCVDKYLIDPSVKFTYNFK